MRVKERYECENKGEVESHLHCLYALFPYTCAIIHSMNRSLTYSYNLEIKKKEEKYLRDSYQLSKSRLQLDW